METDSQSSSSRRRTLLSAKIIFNDRSSVFDCTVRTLSDDGADIRMNSTLGVPDAFMLIIKAHQDVFHCEIVQRSETDLAVNFAKRSDRPALRARPAAFGL